MKVKTRNQGKPIIWDVLGYDQKDLNTIYRKQDGASSPGELYAGQQTVFNTSN